MIDFAVLAELLEPQKAAVKLLMEGVENVGHRTINQTMRTAARVKPIIISVKTKKEATAYEDAKFKLAMWVTAWHNRIRLLEGEQMRCPPLPAFICLGPLWYVYWVLDLGKKVVRPSISSLYMCFYAYTCPLPSFILARR